MIFLFVTTFFILQRIFARIVTIPNRYVAAPVNINFFFNWLFWLLFVLHIFVNFNTNWISVDKKLKNWTNFGKLRLLVQNFRFHVRLRCVLFFEFFDNFRINNLFPIKYCIHLQLNINLFFFVLLFWSGPSGKTFDWFDQFKIRMTKLLILFLLKLVCLDFIRSNK